jgi:hypothetical protein
MTRTDLRTLVLSWLDDTQGAYFTAAQVNVWLNMAQREVQKLLLQAGENWYMKPVETTMVANQADYVLPTDFMVEHRIEIVLSGSGTTENRQALGPITTNQQDLISIVAGTPTNYYIKKDRVTVSPTPQQGYVMRLYYSPRVADMAADSDSPDVPEQFMEFVAILAAFDGFIKDDRAPTSLVAKKEWYEKLLKEMSEDRTQDQSRQVVMVNDYGGGGAWY